MNRVRDWFLRLMGFERHTEYVSAYFRDANVRSSIYMSFVVMVLEIWMIQRYLDRYVLNPGEKGAVSLSEFFGYTKNFWLLLAVGIAMFVYALMYMRRKVRIPKASALVISVFAGVCLIFGMYVSFSDFGSGKQIMCFLTMVMFVACLLIWRPLVSIIMLGAIFIFFYVLIDRYAGVEGGVRSGDFVNYLTYYIALTMVAISIYSQRMTEASKSQELERIAIYDDLTGMHNLYYFVSETEKIIRGGTEDIKDKLVLFLNIENFKTYNNQFGHTAGDAFLKSTAEKILNIFEGDICARRADDHFLVFTDNTDEMREKLNRFEAELKGRQDEVYMALKAGGCPIKSSDDDINVIIDSARYACTTIKNKYGQNYSEYDDIMDKIYHRSQYVVNNIDSAIANGYIKPYYQPVVWSDSNELCGCEALARWDDPQYGLLSPGVFIPVLEECRQIHKLDKCIFESVCRDISLAKEKGIPFVPVSLNFSRLDFELMDAVNILLGLVDRYNIPKEFLHVEITESALTDDQNKLNNSINAFKEKGFAVWLDDFGSGYSSLNVLKDYKFDVMKIDMVFLRNFSGNREAREIIDCIIQLAKRLDMMTLTEGVETDEQATFLEQAGCDRFQGYLYGKPMPFDELMKKIDEGVYTVSNKLL